MTTQELISARSNEANLGQEEFAWLLFGIHDKTHAVLGSSYKPTRPSLDSPKKRNSRWNQLWHYFYGNT